jgi:hypothetical protein
MPHDRAMCHRQRLRTPPMPIWPAQTEVWTNYGHVHEADERDQDSVMYEYCVPPPYMRRFRVVANRLNQLPNWIRNIPNWVNSPLA